VHCQPRTPDAGTPVSRWKTAAALQGYALQASRAQGHVPRSSGWLANWLAGEVGTKRMRAPYTKCPNATYAP